MFGFLGGLVNGVASYFGAQSNNQTQLEMQANQENYNTQMANTAYQRAQADMKAAGLNPILAATNGGAASPVAPAANLQSPLQAAAGGISQGISTATALKTADATIDNLVAQNAKILAETKTEQNKPAEIQARIANIGADTQKKGEEIDLLGARNRIENQVLHGAVRDALKADAESDFMKSPQGKLLYQFGFGGQQLSRTLDPVSSLVNSAKSGVSVGRDWTRWRDEKWASPR